MSPNLKNKMQVKILKAFVKKIKRGVHKITHVHVTGSRPRPHPRPPPSAPPSPPVFDIVRELVPAHITVPASPRSRCSSDSFAKGEFTHHGHDLGGIKATHSTGSSSEQLSSESSASAGEDMSGENVSEEGSLSHPTPSGLVIDNRSESTSATRVLDGDSSQPHRIPDLRHDEIVKDSVPASTDAEVPMFTSPPAVYVEPEVPDPFLVDDPEDPTSCDEDEGIPDTHVSESQQTVMPADEILLTRSPVAKTRDRPLSPDFNKAVPPPPSSESDQEEGAPELYLTGLVIPTMFLPIPNTDPLTTLLTKYINPLEKRPVRDVSGDWQRTDFHTLVMTNSWRSLARMARDRIVTTDPEDVTLVLSLWYLRLACLARLRLFNQTSAECTNLFSVLNAVEPPASRAWLFDRLLPFELEIMHTRLKYWAGDHMAYLDALSALLRKCKTKARLAMGDTVTVAMWQERGARLCLIIASQLVEMKDFTAATNLLEPLCNQPNNLSSPALRSSIARIYLQAGNIRLASQHFEVVASDANAEQSMKDMNAALLASAKGEWTHASDRLRKLIAQDADNFIAVNNLSVALLSQGRLKEGIDVLETALQSSPSSVVVAEPFLFNLSTLYELRSATALEKKRNLLIEVAKWSGDGLKTTCLKMPSS